jgi:hypothetical protein
MEPFPFFLKMLVSKSYMLESMSRMTGFLARARLRAMTSRE